MQSLLDWMGTTLAHYLSKPVAPGNIASATPVAVLQRVLQPADVLLVEGCSRFSTAIKYLSQSTWSHAALFVGPGTPGTDRTGTPGATRGRRQRRRQGGRSE